MKAGVVERQAVTDGVLNLNKQPGWTSHDVVAKLRAVLGVRRIGHAGTLDPSATGVLPILVGKATRIAEYLVEWDKEYRVVLRLGETTDTQDATGTVLATRSVEGVTPGRIREVVAGFVGSQRQLPPMYSAVKVNGVPLYKSARSGRTVERETREITVHDIAVADIAGCDVTLLVRCSKGTYVRTLCADIGEALGVGGHVRELARTRVGPLRVEDALTVDEVAMRQGRGELGELFMPMDQALGELPAASLDQATSDRVVHGVAVPLQALRWEAGAARPAGTIVRLKDPSGRLLALGSLPQAGAESGHAASVLAIVKVFADP